MARDGSTCGRENELTNVKTLATDLLFPEGPVALGDGSIILVEMRGGALRRVWPDGAVTLVCNCGGGPNGAAVGPDGLLYVCNNGGASYAPGTFFSVGPAADYTGGAIQRVDIATGRFGTLYDSCDGQRLTAPNDLVFDRHGGFYFTDMGKKHARHRMFGGLYYARVDGSGVRELAYPMTQPNGVGLSPDGGTVYVAETETSRLWAFDLVAPGEVRPSGKPPSHGGRLVCGLPGYQGFDSLAVDEHGNICVATLTAGCITVIAPTGEVLRQTPVGDPHVTNICFGGPDMRTAFITLAGRGELVSMPWPERGLPLAWTI